MTSIKSIKFSNIQMLWSNAWRNERDDSVQKIDVRKPVGYVNEMCRTISNFHFIVLWLNCLKVFECHSLRWFCYVWNPTQNLSVWCSLLNKKTLRRIHAVINGYWLHSSLIILCKEKWTCSYSYKSVFAWKVLGVGGSSITANLF